jgi:CRP-like cAMP-binding protein
MELNPRLVTWLRQVPFMRNLPVVYRQELARLCYARQYDAGDAILEQGDLTDRFFVVAEGHVHFRRTDPQGVDHPAGNARPGQHFGVSMFTTQELSGYTAEALTGSTVYVMEREAFDGLVASEPSLLKAMPEINVKRRRLTHGFKWLTPGEEVVLTTHRHRIALLQSAVPPLAVGLLLGVVLTIVYRLGLGLSTSLLEVAAGIIVLFIAGWLAYSVNDWANDDFIVTNKRVAQAERIILTSELRNQIPISKIQSITVRKSGPLESALGVSTLEVRSAGREASRIVFDRVANAELISQKIEQQQVLLRGREQAALRRRFREHIRHKLTPYIFKTPVEEAPAEPPKPRRRRSLAEIVGSFWSRMFGREFRDGSTITWRKHWVALLRQAGRWALIFIVLLVGLVLYWAVPFLQILPRLPTLAVFAFLLLVALGGLAWEWEDWRNDIYQVNDREIIDIERLPFGFRSRSTQAPLINIQDARSLRPNPLSAILNFGNVEVQTAGGGPPLIFYDVPLPEEIVEEIFRRIEGLRLRRIEHEIVLQSQNVANALIEYHHLVEKRGAAGNSTAKDSGGEAGAQAQISEGSGAASELDSGAPRQTLAEASISPTPRDDVIQEFTHTEEGEESS